MKKIKKIIALGLLISVLVTNIPVVTAEWTHTKKKLIHKPFWLFNAKDKNKNKNEQLCDQGYTFDILDENGNKIEEYIPEGCKKEVFKEEYTNENNLYFPENQQENNGNNDDFINSLFGESDILIPGENNSPTDEPYTDDSSTDDSSTDDSSTDDSSTDDSSTDEDMDNLLQNIFGKNINKKLDVSIINPNLNLGAKSLVSTIKKFYDHKLEFNLGEVSVKLLKNQPMYNSKITSLISKIDKEFKIKSIKNDFAKNISNLSYSLSTYTDNEISIKTKEVFRKKLINDLKTLKKKYKILKRKDFIVSKTLEKRGEL